MSVAIWIVSQPSRAKPVSLLSSNLLSRQPMSWLKARPKNWQLSMPFWPCRSDRLPFCPRQVSYHCRCLHGTPSATWSCLRHSVPNQWSASNPRRSSSRTQVRASPCSVQISTHHRARSPYNTRERAWYPRVNRSVLQWRTLRTPSTRKRNVASESQRKIHRAILWTRRIVICLSALRWPSLATLWLRKLARKVTPKGWILAASLSTTRSSSCSAVTSRSSNSATLSSSSRARSSSTKLWPSWQATVSSNRPRLATLCQPLVTRSTSRPTPSTWRGARSRQSYRRGRSASWSSPTSCSRITSRTRTQLRCSPTLTTRTRT